MYKLIYYVPDSHLDSTKQALFDAGAGQLGNYKNGAWQVLGTGQFMPTSGAKPFIGELDKLEMLSEWRVEIIIPKDIAKQVKQALYASHPYEEVAYEFIPIVDIDAL
ncbi:MULTISPECIES: NGG1p interacting factor NIF3 [unclassified Acinetobacter]|uniref:NGG1p interacting factor NIF3 n=1 Tax=unclassified Acinetobacter TaxID=196816 RepID=UPI0035BA9AF1